MTFIVVIVLLVGTFVLKDLGFHPLFFTKHDWEGEFFFWTLKPHIVISILNLVFDPFIQNDFKNSNGINDTFIYITPELHPNN